MDLEEAFNDKLRELVQTITSLPLDKQKQLIPLMEEAKDNIDQVVKPLIDIRICLKYLFFDLEATRRERDALKALLNKRNDDDDEPNKVEGEM